MNKCISCKAELPLQARFCGNCGATQPSGTNAGESESLATILSNPPAENPPANIPPPPPQPQQNTGERQKRHAEISSSGQEEHKANTNSSTGQFNNPPSGPRPQQQTSYDNYQQSQQSQQLQQPPSNYQPAPQPPYGGGYQHVPLPEPLYGNYPSTPLPQPPYNYQPIPQPQSPYGNYPPPQQYGDYQPPPQPYGNYQPPLQPAGIHTPDTTGNVNADTTGPKPVTTGTPPKKPAWSKWVIIPVVVVVILAGTGILLAARFLATPPPTPVIRVTSDYQDNGKPAGAGTTKLHVEGKQFATNSAITFLLDSAVIKEGMQPESDTNGNLKTDLTVTSEWSTGQHKLTARDASNNTTKTGETVSIVQQGYNSTPGPNGAPTNTANFKITIQYHTQGANAFADEYELEVKGQSDSQGGSVCAPGDDGSQRKSQSTLTDGTIINRISTYTCSGTYQGGKITYNQTLATRDFSDNAGNRCTLNSSLPSYIQITGTYTTSHQFSGDIILSSIPASQFTCIGNLTYKGVSGTTGTWTGTVNNSGNTL